MLLIGLLIAVSNSLIAQEVPGRRYKPILLNNGFEHTKWGIEPSDIVYHFAAYTTSFDSDDDNNGDGESDKWGIPEWVAYEIRADPLPDAKYNRPKWMTDSSLYRKGIAPDDATYHIARKEQIKEVSTSYRFVRGHMCPKNAADRLGLNAGWNTHTLLNAVPQLQSQNNGVWGKLEDDIIDWADNNGRVWVVCGPVFTGQSPSLWLGQDEEMKVAVPDALFKVVIKENSESPSGIETISFLFPNILDKQFKDPSQFISTIARLEELTGLTFLSELSPVKKEIESNRNKNLSSNEKKQVFASWN